MNEASRQNMVQRGWTVAPVGRGGSVSATADDSGVPPADELVRWLASIAEGRDRQAFAALFKHFGPRLKTFFTRSGAAPGVAEDLVQETMLAVWRKASYFDPAKAGVATWIYTIARNQRIDHARRERPRELPPEPEEFEPTAEEAVLGAERDEQVRQALVQLSEEQAEILRMSFYAIKSQSEIAAELGIPLGTVKSRVRLAMNRLRTLLDGKV